MALEPTTSFDARFSDPNAAASPWTDGRQVLIDARLYWITTVRAGGQPHQTPLIGVWHDDALVFTTGPEEQKAVNLVADPRCTFIAGPNAYDTGLDVVLEGRAERIADDGELHRVADAFVAKYGEEWRFSVGDGAFRHEGGVAHVFAVTPTRAFGFAKSPYGQTRWTF